MLRVYFKYIRSYIKTLWIRICNAPNIRIPVLRTISMNTIFDCDRDSNIIVEGDLETVGEVVFQAHGGKISVGEKCYFNRHCIVACRNSINIGKHCLFGPGVYIYDHDHSFNRGVIPHEYNSEAIVIEDDCWIGAKTVILKGSKIGKGSIIGAGAVITGVIPPYSTVVAKQHLVSIGSNQES